MTALWIIISLVSFSVCMLILQSLMRPDPAELKARDAFNLTVYTDQLSELERDLRRDLITKNEEEAARTEIERRILKLANTADLKADVILDSNEPRRLLFSIGLSLGIPTCALALYLVLGSPDIPNVPYSTRDISAEKAQIVEWRKLKETHDLAERLKTTLKNKPNDIETLVLLGRTYATLGRNVDAANAFKKAHDLSPDSPNVLAQYAEALIPIENNTITTQIRKLFTKAFNANPRNPKARYYLALAKAQANDVRGAIQDWIDLIAISPKSAPWIPNVQAQINAAANELGIDPNSLMPSDEAVALGGGAELAVIPRLTREELNNASQMSSAERHEMIRGMVQRLADRLKKNPNDKEGWRRLAHAYRVLGNRAKAADAEARAEGTK